MGVDSKDAHDDGVLCEGHVMIQNHFWEKDFRKSVNGLLRR